MSYCLDINSPLVESESDSFRLLDRLCYCFTRPAIFRWATTQVTMPSGKTFRGQAVRGCSTGKSALPFDNKYILFFCCWNWTCLKITILCHMIWYDMLFVCSIRKAHTVCASDLIPIYKLQLKIREWKTSLIKYLMFLNQMFSSGVPPFLWAGLHIQLQPSCWN